MDDLDKKIEETLKKQNFSFQYHEMIQDTMKKIENDEIIKNDSKVRKIKQKSKIIRFFQGVAACLVVGILSVTAYAGATGKLNINIGNTGHKKIDQNYNEVATAIDKKIDNEYLTLVLESMAADPAYLIFEYDIKLKDKVIEEIGEISYNDVYGYGINLYSETFLNGKEKIQTGGRNLKTIEKISEKEFRLVELYNIANIKTTDINLKKVIHNLEIRNVDTRQIQLNIDISQILTANITFKNIEAKVLAEKELTNGTTLYIEAVSNSKFENFILARTISETKPYKEFWSRESQFMFEDYVTFAICNENNENINYDTNGLENYFEVLQEDGTYKVNPEDARDENWFNIEDDDYVRRQSVQLLKIAIDEENTPKQLKVLPICRKLYNERNSSEAEFYKQEDWYQVELGDVNITETSQVGGSVTVTRIEETEDAIEFYYDKNGFVPSFIDMVVRVKNPQLNYWGSRYYEIKGIDGDENKDVFTKNTFGMAGAPLLGYDTIESVDDLEFALFYNVKYDILADNLIFDWNENESNDIATIENIKFSEFIDDINDKLESIHGIQYYDGIITEVNNEVLKFYSENDKKEYILSNPSQFEYINGRVNEKLDFKVIKTGDLFMYRHWGGNYDKGQCVIIRRLSGNELKEELIKQLASNAPIISVEFVYREATNIEVVDDNKAIITYEIADMYQERIGNTEKFKIKVLVTSDTEIYRMESWAGEHFQISDLETVEYVPSRVTIRLDKNTIKDKMPIATEIDIGWLDEDF